MELQPTDWVLENSGWRLDWPHRLDQPLDFVKGQRAAISHIEDAKHSIDKLEYLTAKFAAHLERSA